MQQHKMKNVVLTRGTGGLEGEFQAASEIDFFIDKDMVHIADTKVARRYDDFFIRNIHKFDEVTSHICLHHAFLFKIKLYKCLVLF